MENRKRALREQLKIIKNQLYAVALHVRVRLLSLLSVDDKKPNSELHLLLNVPNYLLYRMYNLCLSFTQVRYTRHYQAEYIMYANYKRTNRTCCFSILLKAFLKTKPLRITCLVRQASVPFCHVGCV